MSLLEWLIQLGDCGVTMLFRDGQDVLYDWPPGTKINKRQLRRLLKVGVKEGHDRKVLPMVSKLPRAEVTP